MQTKLLEISPDFDVRGQRLIIYSELDKHLRKNANKIGQRIRYLHTQRKPVIQLGGVVRGRCSSAVGWGGGVSVAAIPGSRVQGAARSAAERTI
jgi:hypothetical protein